MAKAQFAADLVQAWAHRALLRLGEEREEIDRLNVFPVPDGDTGTNMFLTMDSAVSAMDASSNAKPDGELAQRWALADAETLRLLSVVQTLARGALLGARGNSGVILSQVMRGMLHGQVRPDKAGTGVDVAHLAASALTAAARLAYESVGDPVEGTILTVIRVAAESASAASEAGGSVTKVVSAAVSGARTALEATPTMLPALAAAGVVDSGGAGMVVVLEAMLEELTGVPPPARPHTRARVTAPDGHAPQEDYEGPAYEVMFLLDAEDAAVPALRQQLGPLGDSLVVVGGDGLWNVHVHVDDVGAVIEHAMDAGRPFRIRVTWLRGAAPAPARSRVGRAVVAVAHGDGVEGLIAESGVVAVRSAAGLSPSTGELLEAVETTGAQEVVLLPGGKDIRSAAESAAIRAREAGIRVAVVPTRAIVQSLAAIAVHDPERDFDDDVAAMSRAAGATRYGGVTVSNKQALTSAGICQPGDILGLVSGDIAQIGSDTVDVAMAVLADLVRGGSELITVLAGQDLPDEEFDSVTARIEAQYPELDLLVTRGGQPLWPIIIGVE